MTDQYYHSLKKKRKTTFALRPWLALFAVTLVALSLVSCGGGSSRSGNGGAGGDSALPAPGPGSEDPPSTQRDAPPEAEEDPTPTPSPEATAVPPVGPNNPQVIETGTDKLTVKQLIFESEGNVESGRFLDEFLIAVKASEPSCIRLKVRPTEGVADQVAEAALPESVLGSGACENEKVLGEGDITTKTPTPTPEATANGDNNPNLNLALTDFKSLDFKSVQQSSALKLAGASAALCSARLFRMPTRTSGTEGQVSRVHDIGVNKGLENVVSKTGRLMAIGKNVRLWIDDEFANYCTGGTPIGDPSRLPLAYGPLRESDPRVTDKDKLYQEHLDAIVQEMDKIFELITSDFGGISDIDGNSKVEIFLSPEVNRTHLYNFSDGGLGAIDNVLAAWPFKPEDLAAYNSETNPTSNEGEILYLWTPDPAGIYNYGQFASANSLTSNYARGFLSAQLMNLIIAKARLLDQESTQNEDLWLSQALSMLASGYYGGSEYALHYLTQFYSGRPQYLSLTQGLSSALHTTHYLNFAVDEQIGLRTAFGWYLHSRWCGAGTATPCGTIKTNIKAMLQGQTRGAEAVAAILNQEFPILLNNFALSMGISYLPDPNRALSLWDKSDAAALPPKPFLFNDLFEIRSSAPPLTKEIDRHGNLIAETPQTSRDRTIAGPIPSKAALTYQVVLADNDIEFKLDKDSVAYILVTGLLEKRTDVTGIFGPGLNVTFIPVGSLDTNVRRMHIEKVSELAHDDFRPDNLTSSQDTSDTPALTTMYAPFYANGLNHQVTSERELWILGSIDSRAVNVQDSLEEWGDEDSYLVEFNPCEGLDPEASSQCLAGNLRFDIIAQVYIRDFLKELDPMLLVTTPERKIYRGYTALGNRDNIIAPDEGRFESSSDLLCPSEFDSTKIAIQSVDITDLSSPIELMVASSDHGLEDNDLVELTALAPILPPRGLSMHVTYFADIDDTDPRKIRLKANRTDPPTKPEGAEISEIFLRKGEVTIPLRGMTLGQGPAQFRVAASEDLSNFDRVVLQSTSPLPHLYQTGTNQPVSPRGRTFFITDLQPAGTDQQFTLAINQFNNAPKLSGGNAADKLYLHKGDKNICSAGGIRGKPFFDHDVTLDSGGYRHNYYNFLSLGEPGFPFTTRRTRVYPGKAIECSEPSCYLKQEVHQQIMTFGFDKEFNKKLRTIQFHSLDGRKSWPLSGKIAPIEKKVATKLASVKAKIDSCDPGEEEAAGGQGDLFVEECTEVTGASEDQCRFVCGENGYDVQAEVLNNFNKAESDFALVCRENLCDAAKILLNAGSFTSPWIPFDRFFHVLGTPSTRTSYNYPTIPDIRRGSDYCLGAEPNSEAKIGVRCEINDHPDIESQDIRKHLHIPANQMMIGQCTRSIDAPFGDGVKACFDAFSYQLETSPDNAYPHLPLLGIANFARDRSNISRFANIHQQTGEVIAKPERIAGQLIRIQSGADSQILQFTVGGRKRTQGRYLLRLRVVPAFR